MRVEKVPVTIEDKLKKINDIYSECLSEEPHLFNKLRDNEKKKMKNHVLSDVIDTMINTWCSIEQAEKDIGKKVNKGKYFLFIYGLLQVMYVHQDLMDELLWVCKICNEKATKKRELVRGIRNELVGHPINTVDLTDGQELVSTAVWCWYDIGSEEGIQHVEYLYRKEGLIFEQEDEEENKYGGQEQRKYRLGDLIQKHKDYINYCLDEVLKVFSKHLNKHIKQQESILKILGKEPTKEQYKQAAKRIDDENIGVCQMWNKWSGYNSYNNLVAAIDKMDEAPRYKSFIEDYFKDVVESLEKGKDNIYKSSYDEIVELLSCTKEKTIYEDSDLPNIEIVIKSNFEDYVLPEPKEKTLKEKTSYYISKLYEQKYYNDLDVMRRILKDYPDMLVEIEHMDNHWGADKSLCRNDEYVDRETEMEYFVALIYLDKMIRDES